MEVNGHTVQVSAGLSAISQRNSPLQTDHAPELVAISAAKHQSPGLLPIFLPRVVIIAVDYKASLILMLNLMLILLNLNLTLFTSIHLTSLTAKYIDQFIDDLYGIPVPILTLWIPYLF